MEDICAVVLAGGKSSRMKRDKTLLKLTDKSLIEYQYLKLSKIFKNVYISAKNDKFNFLEDKSFLIFDENETYSPMIALNSIFKHIKENKVFIITVDMPFIENKTVLKLLDASNQSEIVVAKDDFNRHNLCGVFHKSISSKVQECLDNDIHKINYLINHCDYKELFFENSKEFFNINTPDDFDVALKLSEKI